MNTNEGLTRIATVIRGFGKFLVALCGIGALVALAEGHGLDGKAAGVFGAAALGAFFYYGSSALGWILEGFAAPRH